MYNILQYKNLYIYIFLYIYRFVQNMWRSKSRKRGLHDAPALLSDTAKGSLSKYANERARIDPVDGRSRATIAKQSATLNVTGNFITRLNQVQKQTLAYGKSKKSKKKKKDSRRTGSYDVNAWRSRARLTRVKDRRKTQ